MFVVSKIAKTSACASAFFLGFEFQLTPSAFTRTGRWIWRLGCACSIPSRGSIINACMQFYVLFCIRRFVIHFDLGSFRLISKHLDPLVSKWLAFAVVSVTSTGTFKDPVQQRHPYNKLKFSTLYECFDFRVSHSNDCTRGRIVGLLMDHSDGHHNSKTLLQSLAFVWSGTPTLCRLNMLFSVLVERNWGEWTTFSDGQFTACLWIVRQSDRNGIRRTSWDKLYRQAFFLFSVLNSSFIFASSLLAVWVACVQLWTLRKEWLCRHVQYVSMCGGLFLLIYWII